MTRSRLPAPLSLPLLAIALLGANASHLAARQGATPSAAPGDTVRVEQGLATGIATPTPGVRAYLGLPFAAPPVGALRWREPRPALPWEGVRQATRPGSACIQNLVRDRLPWTREFMVQEDASEDCLYLNVWTAAAAPTERRPVLVFVHGGGFNEGSGAIDVYNGEKLAQRGLVVVTINYRVGALGFFAHPLLAAESPGSASGNYGLHDVLAALRWVQRNAAAFGGDPSRVTVGGQSAGAVAVHAMVASPLAAGLFHRAIAESGTTYGGPALGTRDGAERAGLAFAEWKGARTLEALRALPVNDFLNLPANAPRPTGRPIVDGWLLPTDAQAAFAQRRHNDVPVLAGLQADEGSGPASYGRMTPEAVAAQARERFGARAERFLRLYPGATPEESGPAHRESVRDQGRVSLHLWAAERARTSRAPAYTYFFSRAIPWPAQPHFGAFHTGEIPYVFGTLDRLDRPWTEVDRRVSDTVMSYWVNFATHGDPNGAGLPRWPAFDASSRRTMELGERVGPIPVTEPGRFEFWQETLRR